MEQYSPEDPVGKKVLTAALMKRAITDVDHIFRLREEKPSLSNLIKQGAVGEDLWERLLDAERNLDIEVQEVLIIFIINCYLMCKVMDEAEFYKPGWKDTIFQEASAIYQRQVQMEAEREAREMAMEEERMERSDSNEAQDSPATSPAAEEERQRIIDELLQEEEKEQARKRNNKKKKK